MMHRDLEERLPKPINPKRKAASAGMADRRDGARETLTMRSFWRQVDPRADER